MNRLRLTSLLVLVLPLAACGNRGPLTLAPKPPSAPPPSTQPMPAAPASAMPAPGTSVAAPPSTEGNDGTPGQPR